jgi:hypothetical protein
VNTINRQFLSNTCPRVTSNSIAASLSSGTSVGAQANVGPGLILSVATSTTAGVINLARLFKPLKNPTLAATLYPGIVGGSIAGDESFGNKISIAVLTSNLFVNFAPTIAQVTGSNVPLAAAEGTLNASGIYTPSTNNQECWPIFAGTYQTFNLRSGMDIFMGFVAAAAGQVWLYQSSDPTP